MNRPENMAWLGDRALTLYLPQEMSRRISRQARQIADEVRRALPTGQSEAIIDVMAAFASVTWVFDRPVSDPAWWEQAISELLSAGHRPGADSTDSTARHRIAVCFDEEFAPDLPILCEKSGLSRAGVIARLCDTLFYAYMVGFMPGFAYLGEVPEILHLPRRTTPRTQVPPGSLAVAGAMAAIYPVTSPGGWNLIGRTAQSMFDARAARPHLIAAGDEISLTPQSRADYELSRNRGGNLSGGNLSGDNLT